MDDFDEQLRINDSTGFSENRWYPPYSYLAPLEIRLYDNSLSNEFKQYSVMFYSATMMLGLENEGPVNFLELAYQVSILIIASLMYNLLFS